MSFLLLLKISLSLSHLSTFLISSNTRRTMIAAGTHRGRIPVRLTPSAPSTNAAATAARPQPLWQPSHSLRATPEPGRGLHRAAVSGKSASAKFKYPTHLCGVLPSATGSSSPSASPTQVNKSTRTCRAACGRKTRGRSLSPRLPLFVRAIREMAIGARRHQATRRTTPWTCFRGWKREREREENGRGGEARVGWQNESGAGLFAAAARSRLVSGTASPHAVLFFFKTLSG